jgi:hypothetical protein
MKSWSFVVLWINKLNQTIEATFKTRAIAADVVAATVYIEQWCLISDVTLKPGTVAEIPS